MLILELYHKLKTATGGDRIAVHGLNLPLELLFLKRFLSEDSNILMGVGSSRLHFA